jgi:hypothetical protein
MVPSCVAVSVLRDPLRDPTGVREAATITTSWMVDEDYEKISAMRRDGGTKKEAHHLGATDLE